MNKQPEVVKAVLKMHIPSVVLEHTYDELVPYIERWLSEHPEVQVLDGSITEAKLNSVLLEKLTSVDTTLSISGKAADAKATGDAIKAIKAINNKILTNAEAIESINAKTDKNTEDIAKIASTARSNASDTSTLKTRVDNLMSSGAPDDAEYIDARVGTQGETYSGVGEAVRAQVRNATLGATRAYTTSKYNSEFSNTTGGHAYAFDISNTQPMYVYTSNANNDTPTPSLVTHLAFTPRRKCPKYLFLSFDKAEDDARCYIYFYDAAGNIKWDVIDYTVYKTSGHAVNCITKRDNITMIDTKGAEYVRMYVSPSVYVIGWDGVPCGEQFSANFNTVSIDGEYGSSNVEGQSGIQLPKDSVAIIAKDFVIRDVYGITRNDDPTYHGSSVKLRSWQATGDTVTHCFIFPDKHDYVGFYASCRALDDNGAQVRVKLNGSLYKKGVLITRAESVLRGIGAAKVVSDNCDKVNSLKWTVLGDNDIPISEPKAAVYKKNVTHMGVPYSSLWSAPNFVGWHVSPHTFVNAWNDVNSAVYTERVGSLVDKTVNGETVRVPEWPKYGLVCSAYTSLVRGYDLPYTNPSYFFSPDFVTEQVSDPPIGEVLTDGGHAIIVTDKAIHGNFAAFTTAESRNPVTGKYTRYDYIGGPNSGSRAFLDVCQGAGMQEYGWTAKHKYLGLPSYSGNGKTMLAPYADFDDVTIVNGTARPHKGDKSVYTSEELVKINIKDATATKLFYAPCDAELNVVSAIYEKAFDAGTGQVVIDEHLIDNTIYAVWTNKGTDKEYFEYHVVNPVGIHVDNGALVIDDEDKDAVAACWYIATHMLGHPVYPDQKYHPVLLPCNSTGDYSRWNFDGHTFRDVFALFKKGVFGAYCIPLKSSNV